MVTVLEKYENYIQCPNCNSHLKFEKKDVHHKYEGSQKQLQGRWQMIDEDALELACDAYCKVCGHYHHTVPIHICRQDCRYYREFRYELKTKLKNKN